VFWTGYELLTYALSIQCFNNSTLGTKTIGHTVLHKCERLGERV